MTGTARAPASSANLGPGFDAIALALGLYATVEVTDAPSLTVTMHGQGTHLAADATNLAARVASEVAGHDRLAVAVHSEIPPARGLGSSAAIALAAAAAAGAPDPLAVAVMAEGHPENAAASFCGGLVTAAVCDGEVVVAPLALDPALRVVVVVPDAELATAEARRALPATLARSDVVFNLQRLGLLIAGLADLDALSSHAMEDRLHQPWRAPLFPAAAHIAERLRAAGALGACWSGAGPSVLAVVTSATSGAVAEAGRSALGHARLAGTVVELAPDRDGLVSG